MHKNKSANFLAVMVISRWGASGISGLRVFALSKTRFFLCRFLGTPFFFPSLLVWLSGRESFESGKLRYV